jgi:hypothetical protein
VGDKYGRFSKEMNAQGDERSGKPRSRVLAHRDNMDVHVARKSEQDMSYGCPSSSRRRPAMAVSNHDMRDILLTCKLHECFGKSSRRLIR